MKSILLTLALACLCMLAVNSASAQCVLQAVSNGPAAACGANCINGGAPCNVCTSWTISTSDGSNITDLTITSLGGGTPGCNAVCSMTAGWVANRNTCQGGPPIVISGAGTNTVTFTICGVAALTFAVTSSGCGGTVNITN